jgi:hypothetical protein
MAAEIGLGDDVVREVMESFEYLDSSPVDRSTNLRQKNVCWNSLLLKVVTFFVAS